MFVGVLSVHCTYIVCVCLCTLYILQDGRCVGGAGSTEVELSRQIEQFGSQCPGLEQYSIKKFAEALKVFPKVSRRIYVCDIYLLFILIVLTIADQETTVY